MQLFLWIAVVATSLSTSVLCQGNPEDDKDLLGTPYFMINLEVDSYILPFLNYTGLMLEPYIDAETFNVHLNGHHNAYRLKLNDALQKWRQQEPDNPLPRRSVLFLLQNLHLLPDKYFTAIRNNGGGYVNHNLYWGCMTPNLDGEQRFPEASLLKEITEYFESYDKFRQTFTDQALSLFGSGYTWLIRKGDGSLDIVSTVNQDSPISQGDFPLLVLDVWEHAYYLKHKNKRKNHIEDWWNLVDWVKVTELDAWWKEVTSEGDKSSKKVEL